MKPTMALQGSVWMTIDGQKLGGHDRVELLAAIASTGSITSAAKAVGISYKGAWDAIEAMNNLAGEPLLERAAGGKGGGGTRLTPRGAQLVDNFRKIDEAHRQFIAHLSGQSHALADDFLLLQRMKMKTSARNQFSGRVAALKRGVVNDEVTLEIAGGQRIVATITRDSSDSLGLTIGAEAFALIKSSSVIVVAEMGTAKLSARNQLAGTVTRLQTGAVNTEVSIELGIGVRNGVSTGVSSGADGSVSGGVDDGVSSGVHDGAGGGGVIAAVVTRDSADALALAVGSAVCAVFKASSVIIGTPA